MRIFFDTSVLVAASLESHPSHLRADAVLDKIGRAEDIGYASTHVLAETFAVLSRLPTQPKLAPQDVLDILETEIVPNLTFVSLHQTDYLQAIRSLAVKGLGGGRIYDLLHLRAAASLKLDRIYTFNEAEWKTLAPELASIISAPPANIA